MPNELENDQLKLVIESVLFIADGPVELRTLARLTEQTPEAISQAIEELGATSRERGVRIQRTGQSAQMRRACSTPTPSEGKKSWGARPRHLASSIH